MLCAHIASTCKQARADNAPVCLTQPRAHLLSGYGVCVGGTQVGVLAGGQLRCGLLWCCCFSKGKRTCAGPTVSIS